MGRPRKFDYDAARALRAAGWRYAAIARQFGVSCPSVRRACDDAYRERHDAELHAYTHAARKPCLGGCGRRVWLHGRTERSGYCRSCLSKIQTTSVRETTLRCSRCHEWKLDADYAGATRNKQRRGRHDQCRDCNTAAVREWRAANQEHIRAYDRERRRRKAAA